MTIFVSITGRQVLYVPDALQLPAVDQFGDALLDGAGAGLVRQLGDDDLGAVAGLFDRGLRPHPDRTPPRPVGVDDPLAAQDQARRWESPGPLTNLMRSSMLASGLSIRCVDGVYDFAQVVRRDVRRHTHGDPLAPVDQQVGEPRRAGRWARRPR